MKIKVQDKPVEREIEVTLPVYRCHNLEHRDIYMRVDEYGGKLREVSVSVAHGPSYELEINNDYRFDEHSGEDYNTGTGEYASSRQLFGAALLAVLETTLTLRETL